MREKETAIARSTADAPEIDGMVYIDEGAELPVGEFAQVRIVDADEHDLYADLLTRIIHKEGRFSFNNLI